MLKKYQKSLRKNLTETETLLWSILRNRVLRFWNNDFLKERTNVSAIIYDALIKS